MSSSSIACCVCDRTHVPSPIQVSWDFPRGAFACSVECRIAYDESEAQRLITLRQVPQITYITKFPNHEPTKEETEELVDMCEVLSNNGGASPLLSFDDMCKAIAVEERAEQTRQISAQMILHRIAKRQSDAIRARQQHFLVETAGLCTDISVLAIVDAKLHSLQLQRTPCESIDDRCRWEIRKLMLP